MPSVIFGLLALALGLFGVTAWWWSVTEFLRGAVPVALIILGMVALAAGVQSVRLPRSGKGTASDPDIDG
jgi:FtsH-binding integral membrane protein